MRTDSWLSRHPLPAYFLCAYGITWGGIALWFATKGFQPAVPTTPEFAWIVACMLAGPAASGLALTAWLDGRAGLRELWLRFTRWNVGTRWYGVAPQARRRIDTARHGQAAPR